MQRHEDLRRHGESRSRNGSNALLLCLSFVFSCQDPSPPETRINVEQTDGSVFLPSIKTDVASDGGTQTRILADAAAHSDAEKRLALPPEAGVQDLEKEACPTGHCFIKERCYRQGQLHPFNDCQSCEPARARHHWTAVEDGSYCEDGLWCTSLDRCRLGYCTGERRCDDHEVCRELAHDCRVP